MSRARSAGTRTLRYLGEGDLPRDVLGESSLPLMKEVEALGTLSGSLRGSFRIRDPLRRVLMTVLGEVKVSGNPQRAQILNLGDTLPGEGPLPG